MTPRVSRAWISRAVRFLPLIVVLGIALWGAFGARANLQQAFDRETQIQQAQTSLEAMLRVQIDEENSVRGYIESQDGLYKDQYATALTQLAQKEADVRAALQAQNLTDVEAQLDEYIRQQAQWRTTVAEPQLANPRSRPVDIDRTNKFFTDAEEDISGSIRDALDERSNSLASEAIDRVDYALIFSAVFFVIFFGIALWIAWSELETRRTLDRSRTTVETLQSAFKSTTLDVPHCDVGSAYAAASADLAVGGDIFDMYRLSESRTLLTIADVSGKGVDAAVLTAFIRFTIESLALRRADPGAILADFNRTFSQTYTVRNPTLFVSMFVGILNTEQMNLTYASGGHDSAFVRRSSNVQQLAVTGPILGVMEEPFDTRVLQLEDGDTIVLATDGLTEARDRHGELLQEKGAMELIAAGSEDPQQLADGLVAQVKVLGGNRMRDDLAILAIRVHDPESAHA